MLLQATDERSEPSSEAPSEQAPLRSRLDRGGSSVIWEQAQYPPRYFTALRLLLLSVAVMATLFLFAPSSVKTAAGISITSTFCALTGNPCPDPCDRSDGFCRDADGVACLVDGCCRSDHCAGFPPFSVCVECTEDAHCPENSQPFCFEKKCSTHKHGKPLGP